MIDTHDIQASVEMPDGMVKKAYGDLCHVTVSTRQEMEKLIEQQKAGTAQTNMRNPESLRMIVPADDLEEKDGMVSLTEDAARLLEDMGAHPDLMVAWIDVDGEPRPTIVNQYPTHTIKDRFHDRGREPGPVEVAARMTDSDPKDPKPAPEPQDKHDENPPAGTPMVEHGAHIVDPQDDPDKQPDSAKK